MIWLLVFYSSYSLFVFKWKYIWLCIYVHAHVHILYTHLCMHMHACVCISVWVCMYIYIYISIYVLKFCLNSTIFFWHPQKLRQGVYLRDFSIVIYEKFNSNFPVLFSYFFHLVCKCFKLLFSPFLLVSKLYELNLWFQRCPEA